MNDYVDGKDETIVAFLRALSMYFTEWEIRDHWEGDRCAIGLVSPSSPGHLAYVSSWSQPPQYFYVELEVADGLPHEYRVIASLERCSLRDAIDAVIGHLTAGSGE
jgi:hypothetical protein